MESDSHANRARSERVGQLRRCRNRPRRGREGEEEGVALRVDLDPSPRSAGFADQQTVFGQRFCVGLGAELIEQARRALDVGE